MVQGRGCVGFALEHAERLRPGQFPGEDHLQGDLAVQAQLPGAIDHPHAPARDFRQQFVIAKAPDAESSRLSGIGRFGAGDGILRQKFRQESLGEILGVVFRVALSSREDVKGVANTDGTDVRGLRRILARIRCRRAGPRSTAS